MSAKSVPRSRLETGHNAPMAEEGVPRPLEHAVALREDEPEPIVRSSELVRSYVLSP